MDTQAKSEETVDSQAHMPTNNESEFPNVSPSAGHGYRERSVSPGSPRPPLPPRPNTLSLLGEENGASPGNLQARPTTAVSLPDTGSRSRLGRPQEGKPTVSSPILSGSLRIKHSLSQLVSSRTSEAGDNESIRSSVPNVENGEREDIFGDFVNAVSENDQCCEVRELEAEETEDEINGELEPVGQQKDDGANKDDLLEMWKNKMKHYLILSAAGKPIWTRHGDASLVSSYIGVIQTIISFYEGSGDRLSGFSAGDTKFVILTRGPIHLVAISRMVESEAQIKLQLEALYMQILSTLTLPSLVHLFSVRPSTDLKRPLQGSETLLSTLADSFTKGSFSTLLSALESLKIRKSHRQLIDNALLKTKVSGLLYGLVVAGGRLVSVIRPKKHSLHPGDLQLLFNMIFEADGVKAGGGESWIPVCLPEFNNNGYLYMYVSFLDLRENTGGATDDTTTKEESVAIILISANKDSFFELQSMRNAFVQQMEKNGSIKAMRAAIATGRPSTTDIVPETVLHHFLYKSRANVQFTMSSYDHGFGTESKRRRLMSIYASLHASAHAKDPHIKVHHCVSRSTSSFAWITPVFELYCVSSPNANRNALAQSASRIVHWVRQEEERLFIIGGAVF